MLNTKPTELIVIPTMGTMATIMYEVSASVRFPSVDQITRDLEALFFSWEQRFSRFIPESELNQINRGQLTVTNASAPMQLVFEKAFHWRKITNGAFEPHDRSGKLDFNAIVKALAIQDAASYLDKCFTAVSNCSSGVPNYCVNVGGDILISGKDVFTSSANSTPSPQKPWVSGIVNPSNPQELISQFIHNAQMPAIATSGIQQRGNHIWSAQSELSKNVIQSTRFCQVSVAAESIEIADILATAIISGGSETMNWATDNFVCEILAFADDDQVFATKAFLCE